jgi:hypothetical protein
MAPQMNSEREEGHKRLGSSILDINKATHLNKQSTDSLMTKGSGLINPS